MKTVISSLAVAVAVSAQGVPDTRLFLSDVKTVGVASISSILDENALAKGTNLLVRSGYHVKVMPNVKGPDVAPADVRARLLTEAWLDPEIDLLVFSRGGEGAEEVLPLLDWEKLRKRDMRVVGFSDLTLILNAMLAKGAGHPYSGPMISSMSHWNRESSEWFGSMMNGEPMNPLKIKVLKAGAASGLPMGGHVTRMHQLCTKGLAPSAKGRVVFFECTARHPADKVISNLEEMRDGGHLAGAAAVVFSDFRHKGEERKRLDAFFQRFAQTLDCPVFAGFPYGHCNGSLLLDFRRKVSISADGEVTWPLPPNGKAFAMQNIAHRGMWGKDVPQNTVESIRRAYSAGATWVETDFHHTKAGQMVCIHAEKELKSYTGSAKKVVDLTPEDIATLNLVAGGVPEAAKPETQSGKTYRIPLLDQVLAVVPKHGVLQSEIKGYSPQYADIFEAAVKKAGLTEENIVVSSFKYKALKDFKSRYPKYRAAWLVSLPKKGGFDVQEYIAKCKEAGFETFCPGCCTTYGVMTRADADAVRAAGLEFRMWGVNSRRDLEQARQLGATGFTCNFWRKAFEWAESIGGITLLK